MNDQIYNNHIYCKYFTFGALFQTIWNIAVLVFTAFLVLYFQNYWVLFSLVLIFVKPYKLLVQNTSKEKMPDRKSYGSNNPPS